MSKFKYISIVTDLNKFQDRVDEITSETTFDEVKATISDMKKYLNTNKDAVCLCAPQIGVNLRLFIVKKVKEEASGEKYKVFLNPMIVMKEGLHLSRENNLSIPDKEFIIPRANKLHLAYQEYDGHVNSETYVGAYAEVIQQMVEMLDGITLEDYGLEIDSEFDKSKKDDKTKIIEMYLNYLKSNYSSLKTEIENTPELKQLDDTIRFNTGMLLGDIKPVDEKGNVVESELEKLKKNGISI